MPRTGHRRCRVCGRLRGGTREAAPPALLQPDGIIAADVATSYHGGIHADIDLVVLGRGTQDARIPWVGLPGPRGVITQRGQGPVRFNWTSDPTCTVRPIQASSAKPVAAEAVVKRVRRRVCITPSMACAGAAPISVDRPLDTDSSHLRVLTASVIGSSLG
jgi:hypothetical protein